MAEPSFPDVKEALLQEGMARATGYRESMYPEASNFGDFTVEDAIEENFNRNTGLFDSFGAAFQRAGFLYGASELAYDAATSPAFEEDPTWNLQEAYESDSTLRERMDPILHEDNMDLLGMLADSKSGGELSYYLDAIEKNALNRKIAEANWGSEMAGTIASIGIDIGALIAIGVATRGAGVSGLAEAIPLVRAIQGTRLMAAGRMSAFAGLEAGAEQLLHQQTDTSVRDSDILFAMAMGAMIGGGIGAAFPRLAGVDTSIKLTDAELDKVIDASVVGRAESKSTAGAAEVDSPELRPVDRSEVSEGVVAPSARSVLAEPLSKIFPRMLTSGALRSPKRVMVDMGGRGAVQMKKLGLTGNSVFYRSAQRLLKFSTAHQDEITGDAVRGVTGQDILDGFLAASTAVSRQAEFHLRDTLGKMFTGANKLSIAMAAGNIGRTFHGGSVARRMFAGLDIPAFERMADRLRKAEAMVKKTGGDIDKKAILGEDILAHLTDEQIVHLMDGLRKAARDQETFYNAIGKREVELGIIPEEDLIEGYTPQVWNREALKVNKERFKAWMTRVWGQEVDEWWVRKEYKEVLDDAGEVQVAGIREGETLEAFAKRDPEAFNEIQRMWDEGLADAEAAMVRDAESRIDALVEAAEMEALPGILERLVKSVAKDRERLAALEEELKKVKSGKKAKKAPAAKVEEVDTTPQVTNVHKSKATKFGIDKGFKLVKIGDDHWMVWRNEGSGGTIPNKSWAASRVDPETGKMLSKDDFYAGERFDEALEAVTKRSADRRAKVAAEQAAKAEKAAKRAKATSQRALAARKAKMEKLADDMVKLEKKIADKEGRLARINEATAGLESMRKALKGALPKASRSKLKRLYAMQDKQTRRVKKQSSKDYVSDQVEELYRLMVEGDAYMGVVPDKFKITSNRFKRRSIFLGKHEFDEEADMFLMRDQAMMRESFARGVGSQIAVREVYGMKGPDWSRQQLIDEFMSGFEADKIKFKNDPAQLAKIAKEEKEARDMVDFILKDFLGDISFDQGVFARMAAPAMAATSAMVLGKVLLSSVTDLAIQAFAGGRFMTGYASMFRRNGDLFRQLRAEGLEGDELAVIVEGLSTVNGRRFNNYADIERFDFDVPGGKMSKVRRLIDDVATLEGWASMMHVWNKHIRGSFGIDFANQIFKHSQGSWDQLSPSLKMFYQRHGIGRKEMEGLGRELKRAGKNVGDRMVVPDIAKFDAGLYDVWKRAMKGAGDEAMLDPSIGDRPFLKEHALGRLLLQFQSFVFTAADRYMAPLMQSFRLHPGEARNWWSLFIAFGLAGINDGIRAHMYGRGEEWRSNWDTAQGKHLNLSSIFMRSPLAVSGTSWMYENVANTMGASINETSEELVGFKPFREISKWQQGQGYAGILGPTFGMGGTALSVAGNAIEGDFGKAGERVANRIPVLNTLLPQLTYVWMTDKLEE